MNQKYHLVFVSLFFLTFLLIGLNIYSDYGVSTDETHQHNLGLHSYDFIFERDKALLSFRDRDYGVAFELIPVFIEKLFHLKDSREVYLMRHLCTFLMFFLGVLFFYLLCQNYFKNWQISLLGVLFLVLSPRIFAHSFYNSKDIPFLALFIISIYSFVKFLDKRTIFRISIHALISAILIDIRIAGILIPFLTITFTGINSLKSIKESNYKNLSPLKEAFNSLFGYLLLLILFVILFWPFLWEDPFNNFKYAFNSMSQFRWDGEVLYMGQYVKSSNLPWHYIPVWLAITTPVLYIITFTAGILITIVKIIIKPLQYFYDNQKIKELIFIFWFCSPLLAAVILNSVLYDAWRQMFFIYPAFLIFSLIGLKHLFELIELKVGNTPGKALKAIIITGIIFSLANTAKFMFLNHPNQNVYFNMLAGKQEEPPNNNFDLDYWGLSYRQALEYILKNDTKKNIAVYTATIGGTIADIILRPSERERLKYTDKCRAKYFLSNFRYVKEKYPYKDEFYSLSIGGNKIMVAYKLKEDGYHENRIKFYENKILNNKKLIEIIAQEAKANKISLREMVKLKAVKETEIENYILEITCNPFLMKKFAQKATERKISLKKVIRRSAIWLYNMEKKRGEKYLFDYKDILPKSLEKEIRR